MLKNFFKQLKFHNQEENTLATIISLIFIRKYNEIIE